MEELYPKDIMEALRQRKNLEPDDTSRDDEISSMSPNEVFEEVLEWNGICKYAYTIKRWIKNIYGIDLNEMGQTNE